jgi:hypothetical protein
MNKKIFITAIFSLLALYPVFADAVNVSVTVRPFTVSEILRNLLGDIGTGTGNMFSAMGTPMMIFIILIALGSAIGYILSSFGKGLEKE